jgi:hypothetical protein
MHARAGAHDRGAPLPGRRTRGQRSKSARRHPPTTGPTDGAQAVGTITTGQEDRGTSPRGMVASNTPARAPTLWDPTTTTSVPSDSRARRSTAAPRSITTSTFDWGDASVNCAAARLRASASSSRPSCWGWDVPDSSIAECRSSSSTLAARARVLARAAALATPPSMTRIILSDMSATPSRRSARMCGLLVRWTRAFRIPTVTRSHRD